MKRKIEIGILTIIIIGLISSILVIWYNTNDHTSRQVKSVIKFLEKLEEIGAIKEDSISKASEFSEVEIGNVRNPQVKHTIIAENYGVDLDEEYNIVGFLNQGQVSRNEESIDINEAIKIASNYVEEISKKDISLNEVKETPSEEVPYYTISFYKIYKDYVNFNSEIIIKIHENNGELVGYSEVSSKSKKYKDDIEISQMESEEIALKYFKDKEIKGEILSSTNIGYLFIDEEVSQLCRIINYEVKLENDSRAIHQIYISTEDGTILKEAIISENIGVIKE